MPLRLQLIGLVVVITTTFVYAEPKHDVIAYQGCANHPNDTAECVKALVLLDPSDFSYTAVPIGDFIADTISFSPDTNQVLFRRRSDLFVFDIKTQKITKLASDVGGVPTWSPDGTRIAYVDFKDYLPYVINSDGTNRIQLLDMAIFRMKWSPNSDQIALISHIFLASDIFIFDFSTEQTTTITSSTAYEHSLAWSPDGQLLLFSSYEQRKNRFFTTTQNAMLSGWDIFPDAENLMVGAFRWLSPHQMVFSAYNYDDYNLSIYQVDLASENQRLLVNEGLLSWDVSPDGAFVIFTRIAEDNTTQLCFVAVGDLKEWCPQNIPEPQDIAIWGYR